MPEQNKPEDEKKPEDEDKPEDEEEMKKKELEKAGALQTGLTSVKERLDGALNSLKAGTVDDSVLNAVRTMANDLGKLAEAYPSPKSEKREFTSDQFDEFVATEVKALEAEANLEKRTERGQMLRVSVEEFTKALTEVEKTASFEGATPPAVKVTVWKDPMQQPPPSSTTTSATTPPTTPTTANIGKADGGAEGTTEGQTTAAGSPPGEGVQDDDGVLGEHAGSGDEWGPGWEDLTKDIDVDDPIAKHAKTEKLSESSGSLGDMALGDDEDDSSSETPSETAGEAASQAS